MSTKAIRRALDMMDTDYEGAEEARVEAMAELEKIEKSAKDLSRMSVGDFTYSIRGRAAGDAAFSGNTWEHPDVKAWSDASTLVDAIAKDAP